MLLTDFKWNNPGQKAKKVFGCVYIPDGNN